MQQILEPSIQIVHSNYIFSLTTLKLENIYKLNILKWRYPEEDAMKSNEKMHICTKMRKWHFIHWEMENQQKETEGIIEIGCSWDQIKNIYTLLILVSHIQLNKVNCYFMCWCSWCWMSITHSRSSIAKYVKTLMYEVSLTWAQKYCIG